MSLIALDKILLRRSGTALQVAAGQSLNVYHRGGTVEVAVVDPDGDTITQPFTADDEGRFPDHLIEPGSYDLFSPDDGGEDTQPWEAAPGVVVPTLRLGLKPVKQGPVIRSTAGNFDEAIVEGPGVWWDEAQQRWGAVYAGYNGTLTSSFPFVDNTSQGKIGLAFSTDLKTWAKAQVDPIYSVASKSITGPLMWVEDGVYYLFYIECGHLGYEGAAGGGSPTRIIAYATGDNPYGPFTRQGTVVSQSGSGWRQKYVWRPNIVKRRGIYYLFFNATGNTDVERIGYATATSITGPWTVDDTNSPVLSGTGTGTWDQYSVADPCVYRDGDYWYMAYTASAGGGYLGDGLVFTHDDDFPLGWTRHPNNPLLTTGAPWDGALCGKPFIVHLPSGNFHFHAYADTAVTDWGIALAIDAAASEREALHTVGAAGEPAFGAKFANFGGDYSSAHFYRDAGRVHLGGIVTCTSNATAFTDALFTLPVSHGPGSKTRALLALTDIGTVGLDVLTADRKIVPRSAVTSGTEISLDGLSFRQ